MKQQDSLPAELVLQSFWFSGLLGREFTTTEGLRVEIKDFGEWNRGAGPDFFKSAISLDGRHRRGSIELDSRVRDWAAHGHDSNSSFEDVILHVVFEENSGAAREISLAFTKTKNYRFVPRVVIPAEVWKSALNIHSEKDEENFLSRHGRCSALLEGFSEAKIAEILRSAAMFRFEKKRARFVLLEENLGIDQAWFFVLAETLGYAQNSFAFRLLAQRLSLSVLRSEAMPEALLLGASGFLQKTLPDGLALNNNKEIAEYHRKLWDAWWRVRPDFLLDDMRKISLTTNAIRPANHPARRLAALGLVVRQWAGFRKTIERSMETPRAFIDFAASIRDDFWTYRATLFSERSRAGMALFGANRATDFLLNHILPQSVAKFGGIQPAFLKLAGGTPSDPVKRAVHRLFGPRKDCAKWTRYAWQHQGLIQIYRDFCLQDASSCKNCPFPEQLLARFGKT